MNKVPINENFIVPTFQTVNKNQQSTQLIFMDPLNGQLYLLHQYYCTKSQDYGNLITLLQTQASHDNQCQYILNPVVYLPIRFTNQQFQTSHFVQVLYEYGSHTLSEQMYFRIQQKNYFEQNQIWSILGSCVFGLKNLKDKQFTHSSICLDDIFVAKQGKIKLSHPMLRTYDHYHNQSTHLNYLQSVLQQNYYFSPQQLSMNQQNHDQSLVLNDNPTIEDFFKSDIFSLGMSVLALCVLQPVGECYVRVGIRNGSRIVIDSERLQGYFYGLQQVYSNDLLNLLSTMLTYQPLQRTSIDQLALTIQQMIQSSTNNQYEYQSQLRDQFYSNQQQHISPSNTPSQYYLGEKNYQSERLSKVSSTTGKISLGYQQHQRSQNQQMNMSKFGKISRVSQQASPISGRKMKYSSYKQGKTGRIMDLMPFEADNEDKPSPIAIQCMSDYENTDKPINEDQHYMVQSQRHSFNPKQAEQNSKKFKQDKNKTPTIKDTLSPPPSSSSINQTLKQYINHQSESSVSEVNQTRTYQEYSKAVDAKLAQLPKQVVSVMTSKQLCSLPSDSISFVQENYGFWKSQYKNQDKENQINAMNNIDSYRETYLAKSNLRVNQNNINSHHINLSTIKTQTLQPLSSRTYIKKSSTSKNNPLQSSVNLNHYEHKITTKNNTTRANQSKNSFTISLSKDYQNLLKNQNQNPNSMYTDPKFLQAIRQDVNKILTKRGLHVTSSRNSIKQQKKQSFSNQPVFINGKKVQENIYQPLSSPYQPYELQSKPIFYR